MLNILYILFSMTQVALSCFYFLISMVTTIVQLFPHRLSLSKGNNRILHPVKIVNKRIGGGGDFPNSSVLIRLCPTLRQIYAYFLSVFTV